jgi:acyl-coenzyme A thioesterase PaaI-like protein
LRPDNDLFNHILEITKKVMGDRMGEFTFPPPVFREMEGEFVTLDLDAGELSARFPVPERYLNPYTTMQGGMVAAAVDNTIGPLSTLVAPVNVTRKLELTYSHPATPEMGHILVKARLVERQERKLTFEAEVRSPEGLRLARAKAVHWILEGE